MRRARPHPGVAAAHRYPIHGIDISRWQGDIDWASVKGAGTRLPGQHHACEARGHRQQVHQLADAERHRERASLEVGRLLQELRNGA